MKFNSLIKKKIKFLFIEKYIIKYKKKCCLIKNIKYKGFVLKKIKNER